MTRLEKEKVLGRIYYAVEEGFGSVRDSYEKARRVDIGITLDMVSTWMRAQPNKQTRNYKFRCQKQIPQLRNYFGTNAGEFDLSSTTTPCGQTNFCRSQNSTLRS